jgi:hypothetical protein
LTASATEVANFLVRASSSEWKSVISGGAWSPVSGPGATGSVVAPVGVPLRFRLRADEPINDPDAEWQRKGQRSPPRTSPSTRLEPSQPLRCRSRCTRARCTCSRTATSGYQTARTWSDSTPPARSRTAHLERMRAGSGRGPRRKAGTSGSTAHCLPPMPPTAPVWPPQPTIPAVPTAAPCRHGRGFSFIEWSVFSRQQQPGAIPSVVVGSLHRRAADSWRSSARAGVGSRGSSCRGDDRSGSRHDT